MLLTIDYATKPNGYGVYTLIAIFCVIVLTGLRFEVGYDYLNYRDFFTSTPSYLLDRGLEYGFISVVSISNFLGLNYLWLFFSFGILIILMAVRGITLYTDNIRIAFLVFLLIPGLFLNSFSIIRQSIAIAFIFNSFYYLFHREQKKFYMFVILAVLFHYSALAVIPFMLMAKAFKKNVFIFALVGIPLSLVLSKLNVIDLVFSILLGGSKFSVYAGIQDGGSSFTKLLVLNVSVIPYLFFTKRMDDMNKSLLFLVVIGLMLLNVFSSIGAITRISYYFKIFEIVLLANFVMYFKKGWSQIIICVCIFLYFFIMFYSSISFDFNEVTDYPKMTPYKTIFSQ